MSSSALCRSNSAEISKVLHLNPGNIRGPFLRHQGRHDRWRERVVAACVPSLRLSWVSFPALVGVPNAAAVRTLYIDAVTAFNSAVLDVGSLTS